MADAARDKLHERVDRDFTNHPPESAAINEAMDLISGSFRSLAHLVVDRTPVSREQSMALSELEVAKFHAIAAIARYQDAPMFGAPEPG